MNIETIEFLSLSITEEAMAINSYKERAENTKDETVKRLFEEITKDETEHLQELIRELTRVSQ